MKKKRLLILSIITTIACVGVIPFLNHPNFNISANDSPYTFSVNHSAGSKVTSSEASAGRCVRYTNLNNEITLKLNSVTSSSSDFFCKLLNGASIANETKINGILSISVTSKGQAFKVFAGTSSDDFEYSSTFNSENNQSMKEYTFTPDGNVCYFKIQTLSTSSATADITYIDGFSIVYTCVAPEKPKTEELKYEFSGEEKDLRGFAQGSIVATCPTGFNVGSTYEAYWADDNGIISGYYPLGSKKVTATTDKLTFNVEENIYIPASAKKVILNKDNENYLSYDIPVSKQSSEVVKNKFAIFSDVHMNYVSGQSHLTNALNTCESMGIKFIAISGDLGSGSSDYSKYDTACKDSSYTGLIFACLGNHDQSSDGRTQFVSKCIYDGSTKSFVSLSSASEYFKTYEKLDVNVVYEDLEGYGNTYYYYVTVENNLFFFMDQMLNNDQTTATQDNFSYKQLCYLEDTLSAFSKEKYTLNIIEHSPIAQFKIGDIYPAKYTGTIKLGKNYQNNIYFSNILREYKEALWFSGHTHVNFDTAINYVDNYIDEKGNDTDKSLAHCFHVSSIAQTRWYDEGGTMHLPNDYTNGSECYIYYDCEDTTILEARRLKEVDPNQTQYDASAFINKVNAAHTYVVEKEYIDDHNVIRDVDYAKASNGVKRQGSDLSFEDTSDGLKVTFGSTSNRFEIKTGNHSTDPDSYNIEFMIKSSDVSSIKLGGCNYEGGRYTTLTLSLLESNEAYTLVDEGNGWTKVYIPLSTLFSNSVGETFAIRFYDSNAAGVFYLKDFYIREPQIDSDYPLVDDMEDVYDRVYTFDKLEDDFTRVTWGETKSGWSKTATLVSGYSSAYKYLKVVVRTNAPTKVGLYYSPARYSGTEICLKTHTDLGVGTFVWTIAMSAEMPENFELRYFINAGTIGGSGSVDISNQFLKNI